MKHVHVCMLCDHRCRNDFEVGGGGGGRLSHGEHVRSDTSLINSYFKDYVHKYSTTHKIKIHASDATVSACRVLTVNCRLYKSKS